MIDGIYKNPITIEREEYHKLIDTNEQLKEMYKKIKLCKEAIFVDWRYVKEMDPSEKYKLASHVPLVIIGKESIFNHIKEAFTEKYSSSVLLQSLYDGVKADNEKLKEEIERLKNEKSFFKRSIETEKTEKPGKKSFWKKLFN